MEGQLDKHEACIASGHLTRVYNVHSSPSRSCNSVIYAWAWNTGYTQYLPFIYNFLGNESYKVKVANFTLREGLIILTYYD